MDTSSAMNTTEMSKSNIFDLNTSMSDMGKVKADMEKAKTPMAQQGSNLAQLQMATTDMSTINTLTLTQTFWYEK